VSADGSVVRVDGLNEANHQKSFVHAELHRENRMRRFTGLSKSADRSAAAAKNLLNQTAQRQARNRQSGKRQGNPDVFKVVIWVVGAIIALNVLTTILGVVFALLG